MQYFEIAVNVPQISGVFHYHAPDTLEGKLHPGHLVTVPFGAQTVQGVVLREVTTPEVSETRPISDLLDDTPALHAGQIRFAEQLSAATLSSIAAVISLMLPPGLFQQADTEYTAVTLQPGKLPPMRMTKLQQQLLSLLQRRGTLRGRQIDRGIPRANWRAAARGMVHHGLLTTRSVLPPPRVRPKFIRTAQLAVRPERAEAAMPGLGQTAATQERRSRILRFLVQEGVPVSVSWVYAHSGGNMSDLQVLADKDLVQLRETEIFRDPLEGIEVEEARKRPELTPDQKQVWSPIEHALDHGAKHPFLLHGITGSGKTEIYLRAVEKTLQAGRQALILVPEIALTPQTVRRFMARFPGEVGLVHSKLSPGEQYDTWRRARSGDLNVIIGPRSALFSPLKNIGLIVLDESHDNSYYQAEPPFYHAREAAVDYAALIGATCILGSATPSIESRYLSDQGKWQRLALTQRILTGGKADTGRLPDVEVVDMREELKGGNRSIFSRAMQAALAETLMRNEQAILFLNRRGTGTYVFCRSCGHTMRCPRCSEASLTYHRAGEALMCHRCGYKRNMPDQCPECKSSTIRHYGMGTEKVEEEVQHFFPQARALRWDWETTRKKGAHDLILTHFTNHQADILIGTQMLAKGLDLPLVTFVGIVLADVGLNLPDFRAGERVFQTLTQVAGRAGRSALGGKVVLQTFNPDSYVLKAAAGHDYENFYQKELGYRQSMQYPPFKQLIRLEYRSNEAARAENTASALARHLEALAKKHPQAGTEVIGPAPCFYSRLEGRFRWQIVLRGQDPARILAGMQLRDWRVEVNPQSLL